jgi:hypothetical protein
MCSKESSYTLFMGMEISSAIMENNIEVPQRKLKTE